MTLAQMLEPAGLRWPAADAVGDGRRMAYGDLPDQAARLGGGFARLGVGEIPKAASGKILRRLLREGKYTEVKE